MSFRFIAILAPFFWTSIPPAQGKDLTPQDRADHLRCRALQETGDWRGAHDIASQLVRRFSPAPPSQHKLVFRNELANLDQRLGNYGEAIDGYEECLEILTGIEASGTAIESQLKNNLASLLIVLGDFVTAEALSREALALRIAIEGRGNPETVPAMTNLAGLLWCIGDFGEAETLYRESLSLRLAAFGEDSVDTARSQANLGGLLFYRNRIEEATPLIEEAVATFVARAGPVHPETLEAKLFLGELKRAAGDPEAALSLYRECRGGRIDVFNGPEHVEVAEAERRIADALRELERYDDALAIYRESEAHYLAVLRRNHPDLIEGVYGEGLAAFAIGDTGAAMRMADRLSEIEFTNLEAILRFTDERQRLAYQDMFRSHHLYANLAAATPLATHLLRRKGVVIDSLLEEARLMKDFDDPQLASGVGLLREARAAYRTAYMENRENDSLASLEETVRQRRQDLLDRIGGSRTEVLLSHASAADLQAALREGEILIDYLAWKAYRGGARFEDRYGAVVVTPQRIAFTDCGPRAPIDRTIDSLEAFLGAVGEADDATARTLMSQLYSDLVAPAVALAGGARELLICPDAQLSFVPFAATIDGQGRFLVESFDVSYLSASRELLRRPPPARPAGEALLVGNPAFSTGEQADGDRRDTRGILRTIGSDNLAYIAETLTPLEGAEAEVMALEPVLESLGMRTNSLLGAPATEPALRQSAIRPAILHLATHGIYLPAFQPAPSATQRAVGVVPDAVAAFRNPMFGSWVALTNSQHTVRSWAAGTIPDPADDGILMASEAAELDLTGTWIVALSACSTATGEATGGDGVLGIRRGFRMAGAESILTTLWPINDAVTVEIMKDFYRGLVEASPAASLSRVQREWLVATRDNPAAFSLPTSDGGTIDIGGLHWALHLAAPFLLSR